MGLSTVQDFGAPLSLGSTWDAGAAPAGTYVSADQKNLTHRGLALYVNISALTGTGPTVTVTIQGRDPVSGQYFTLLASAALGAVGFTRMLVYPGVPATANLADNDALPGTWRVQVVVAGTTPAATATISACLLI